jgi:hypothetical protein
MNGAGSSRDDASTRRCKQKCALNIYVLRTHAILDVNDRRLEHALPIG